MRILFYRKSYFSDHIKIWHHYWYWRFSSKEIDEFSIWAWYGVVVGWFKMQLFQKIIEAPPPECFKGYINFRSFLIIITAHWTYFLQRNGLQNTKENLAYCFFFVSLCGKIDRNDWFCIPRSIPLLKAVLLIPILLCVMIFYVIGYMS